MALKVDGRHTTTRIPRELKKMRELGDRDEMLWKCWRRTLVWLLLDDEVDCLRRVPTIRRRLLTDDDPQTTILSSSDLRKDQEEGGVRW